jgi:CIC family chloride channel protein
MALLVGIGAGLGAVGFRLLIYAITWLVTGREQFGRQGRVASLHFPGLGIWFLVIAPVVGGLLYGPLIQRFAKEARGHGVPEVMIAVAENGGRIRPQVTGVKALASSICIGFGGSVGREGPIVQIASALASSLGQVVQMSESRLRILVACGAAGGIAATFNAPITGLFFGFELILREFEIDAVYALILSAVTADVIGQAFFGTAPIFSQVPHDLVLRHAYSYLLVILLGVLAGLVGVGFKNFFYWIEDLCDALWAHRPEWLRPAVGGIVLGAVLLALPQMYGVGYPVISQVLSGGYVWWFLLILLLGKIFTSSLTIGIGGSGGVFAPSLFVGAMGGTVFGIVADHLFGPSVGSPAIYGMIAMGAVFAAAAQAPLTSIASVVEMTGNFGLTLPVMLGVGIAAGVSKRLSYGTIYTTKLLRRGTDIDRPRLATLLQTLRVADAMQALPSAGVGRLPSSPSRTGEEPSPRPAAKVAAAFGAVLNIHRPQVLFEDEKLEQALRQPVLFGPDGLPVLSAQSRAVVGWITHQDVLQALVSRVDGGAQEVVAGSLAAEWATAEPALQVRVPPAPLEDYELVEVLVGEESAGRDDRMDGVAWPSGWIPVAISAERAMTAARGDIVIRAGDRLVLIVPSATDVASSQDSDEASLSQQSDGGERSSEMRK